MAKPTATKSAAKKPTAKKPAAAAKPAAKKPVAAAKPAAKKAAPAKPAAAAKSAAKSSGGAGTQASPWQLKTPPGSSEFTAYRDDAGGALVVKVGSTELRYQLRCLDDLYAMLIQHGDWMPLGGADELKPVADGTVEAWGRATSNPVAGWYGMKKGLRGRFGVYVPPVLEALGRVELEHLPKNNRVRAR